MPKHCFLFSRCTLEVEQLYIATSGEHAYSRVQGLPPVAQHEVVNHSLNFVDPTTGVHTQHVESYWNRVKTKFKRMKGVHATMLDSHLDEFMWRERHGQTSSLALHSICRDIAARYPL